MRGWTPDLLLGTPLDGMRVHFPCVIFFFQKNRSDIYTWGGSRVRTFLCGPAVMSGSWEEGTEFAPDVVPEIEKLRAAGYNYIIDVHYRWSRSARARRHRAAVTLRRAPRHAVLRAKHKNCACRCGRFFDLFPYAIMTFSSRTGDRQMSPSFRAHTTSRQMLRAGHEVRGDGITLMAAHHCDLVKPFRRCARWLFGNRWKTSDPVLFRSFISVPRIANITAKITNRLSSQKHPTPEMSCIKEKN